MLAVPDSAGGAEVVPWMVRLEGPHPPQVLRVAGALTDITASRMRALMTGYRLLDVGLLASDRPVVELPDPTIWSDDGDGVSIPVWVIPSGQVSAWGEGIEDEEEGYTEDLDIAEQRALAILAAVAHARRLAAESPSGGGDGDG